VEGIVLVKFVKITDVYQPPVLMESKMAWRVILIVEVIVRGVFLIRNVARKMIAKLIFVEVIIRRIIVFRRHAEIR
jgi:hypothetical protein